MKRDFSPKRLDVQAFAEATARLAGADALTGFTRLAAETVASAEAAAGIQVQWQAQGEQRCGVGGVSAPWLHLTAQVQLPLVCQHCLGPVDTPVVVDRWFRFAADEAAAAAEDEEAEEDVLAARRDFDLLELVEDELLMALPMTPRHTQCPEAVPTSAVDPDFAVSEEACINPFAALETLRSRKGS